MRTSTPLQATKPICVCECFIPAVSVYQSLRICKDRVVIDVNIIRSLNFRTSVYEGIN